MVRQVIDATLDHVPTLDYYTFGEVGQRILPEDQIPQIAGQELFAGRAGAGRTGDCRRAASACGNSAG